jgi:predicted phage-related endonuclease
MLRGHEDEVEARILYAQRYAPVADMGFITNDAWGFTLGCSPDGLVGDDGMIECKSRRQKFQVETIINGEMPADYLIQVQTAMLVTGRQWCDFVSYSGGLPMVTIRVLPDAAVQAAIIKAATEFEARLADKLAAYHRAMEAADARLIPTERRIIEEIF